MNIEEISPQQALGRQRAGAVLVDVREAGELLQGSPVGALRIPLGRLVQELSEQLDRRDTPVLLICASGVRSVTGARALLAAGYAQASSVAGGFQRWKREGLPFEQVSALDADARERYARQVVIPEFGELGQLRLAQARVLLVGAGGLGSPAAFYLAAAGVGQLRLVDLDVVDRSNLQRQILHTDSRIGQAKVESAAHALRALNPRVQVEPIAQRVGVDNVDALLGDIDIVIDGSDNFATRYLLNDACVRWRKPLVYGAVHRFEGQVSVFYPACGARAPCYRCLFPEPPPPEAAPNCAEAGVLGVVPGLVGIMQATEAIKLLTGIGLPLIGRLMHIDAANSTQREIAVPRDPHCAACVTGAAFAQGYQDYGTVCASA
jgi:molybdopterin/thiamine biosynthesis adenylyltransferase/rhodanese-related sulfurtransferase